MAAAIPRPDPDFDVWPENWDAVRVFRRCETQWRYAGMGAVATGLDYTAVIAAMNVMQIADPDTTLYRVGLIERGAMAAMADQRDRA